MKSHPEKNEYSCFTSAHLALIFSLLSVSQSNIGLLIQIISLLIISIHALIAPSALHLMNLYAIPAIHPNDHGRPREIPAHIKMTTPKLVLHLRSEITPHERRSACRFAAKILRYRVLIMSSDTNGCQRPSENRIYCQRRAKSQAYFP